MDRPFREIHELYKILYQRAEAQKLKEEEEAKARENEQRDKGKQSTAKQVPSDASITPAVNNPGIQPSSMELEALEEAFEDMM